MTKPEWILKCNRWKNMWQPIEEQPKSDETVDVNLYTLLDAINKNSKNTDVIMGDAGSISYAGPVALKSKSNQRLVFSPAQADMGWAVPASIGVSLAGADNVIAVTGDGSFMCNMQELAVIKHHNLNIKIVILNNNGYLSIKNTQSKYYDGRVHGTDSETGLTFPDFEKLVSAFDIKYACIRGRQQLDEEFTKILSYQGPVVINVICKQDQEILPAQALKDGKQCGLHDMSPFLSGLTLSNEMIVKLK